ncbi:MAG: alpha/beta fold hydrolase [Flavobacteriales bacterium]|nr:alpha/beta fold hydrolase [Flavobacteriales bacterium]
MELNFKKLGAGEPLIILHGLFGSLDNWMTLAKQWSKSFEVYLVDQRNHGQSPHSIEFSFELMAADLMELIQAEKINNPIILGHSMGGKTAMEFAIRHPELVKQLIVVDIAPVKYEVHHYTIIDALKNVPLNEIGSRKEAEVFLAEKISEFGIRQFLLKNLYWKGKDQLAWRFNLEVLSDRIIPISEHNVAQGLFEKETLFIKGANSNYILAEYENEIAMKFPNYELEIIDGAGHWVHAEKMKEFSEVVWAFLKA